MTLTAGNALGTSTIVSNNLNTVITPFQARQLSHFGCTNRAQASASAGDVNGG